MNDLDHLYAQVAAHGSITKAAGVMGIAPSTLRRRLGRMGGCSWCLIEVIIKYPWHLSKEGGVRATSC